MSDRRPDIDIDIASTEELAAMAAAGDGHAFARLIRLHGEAMTRAAWLVTGHMPAAVDAVRAAWVTAWMGIRKPHQPAALDAWLCRLATVEAERVVHMAVEDVLPPGSPAWTGESALALGQLAPPDRSLLALHHLVGLTPEELDRLDGRRAGRRAGRAGRRAGRRAGSAAVRLAEAWAAIGLDAARAPEHIAVMAAVPVRPVDADAIARLARSEERETRLRIASALLGLAAGVIVMMLPLLFELAADRR